MNLPAVRASIDRRILLNYRVDLDWLARVVPDPFRPLVIRGFGVAGICLIRLRNVRPRGLPGRAGLSSENAAHRIAVEWDGEYGPVAGVYIPRRDTTSRMSAWAGGRGFPGAHHLASFNVDESGDDYRVAAQSHDGCVRVTVAAHRANKVMAGSVFDTVEEASRFFRGAPVAYSPRASDSTFDGVELETKEWRIEALHIDEASSTFFDDVDRFPPGAASVDSAFLMRDIDTTWRPRRTLVAPRRDQSRDCVPT
jgi:hypothetical protein